MLPTEIYVMIIEFMAPHESGNLSLVNKYFHGLVNDNLRWKKFAIKHNFFTQNYRLTKLESNTYNEMWKQQVINNYYKMCISCYSVSWYNELFIKYNNIPSRKVYFPYCSKCQDMLNKKKQDKELDFKEEERILNIGNGGYYKILYREPILSVYIKYHGEAGYRHVMKSIDFESTLTIKKIRSQICKNLVPDKWMNKRCADYIDYGGPFLQELIQISKRRNDAKINLFNKLSALNLEQYMDNEMCLRYIDYTHDLYGISESEVIEFITKIDNGADPLILKRDFTPTKSKLLWLNKNL
jgi:hypothetical protein